MPKGAGVLSWASRAPGQNGQTAQKSAKRKISLCDWLACDETERMAAPRRGPKPAQAQVVPAGPIDTIYALDPGLRDVGLARLQRSADPSGWSLTAVRWIRASAEAISCTKCHGLACDHASKPAQIGRMANAIIANAAFGHEALLVCEWPIVYARQAAPAEDLLDIAGVVGGVLASAYDAGAALWRVLPKQWKGTHAKELHQTWILAALTDEERALVPRTPLKDYYCSDAVDAVGLALWAVGRHQTWRTPPAQYATFVEPVYARKERKAVKPAEPLFNVFSKERP